MTVSLQASPAEEAEADAVPVKEEEEANAADLMMSSEKALSMEPALEDDEDTPPGRSTFGFRCRERVKELEQMPSASP